MSRASTILAGRRFMEETLTAEARFYRPTGGASQDEQTGRETADTATLFSSPCKVQAGALGSLIPSSRERMQVGREITTIREVVKIPVADTPALRADDLFEMTAVGDVDDPALLGQVFRIVAPLSQSYATTRRYAIERVIA